MWPSDAASLEAAQQAVARARPEPWIAEDRELLIGGCWATFPRGLTGPGNAGDTMWAAAVVLQGGRLVDQTVVTGAAAASYRPGLLALRLGPVLETVLRELRTTPDVLMVDASGRDHPRRAGFALHLGAVLDLPTVGVTHRPLLAQGAWPGDQPGDASPLRIDDEVVACWLRTQPAVRPVVVHPSWRVDLQQAVELVTATTRRWRTPEPLRQSRHLARLARG